MKICSPRRAASVAGSVARFQLALYPCLVIRWLLGHNHDSHMRVLGAAVFGAGARVNAFVIRLYADEVGMVGNQIDLSMECRDPEGMDHVERTQFDIDGLANRNVDLVGRCKALRGSAKVLNFPPPLTANNCNRGMQVMMMTVMDWKTGHQFQAQNEKHAEHAQRKCEATPRNPALATPNVDRLVLGERATPSRYCPRDQDPHKGCNGEEENQH